MHLPCTIRTYSVLFRPIGFFASHRYVPLSVLFRKLMLRTLPLTTIRSGSGSSPPSFVHNTGSGLLGPRWDFYSDTWSVYTQCILETVTNGQYPATKEYLIIIWVTGYSENLLQPTHQMETTNQREGTGRKGRGTKRETEQYWKIPPINKKITIFLKALVRFQGAQFSKTFGKQHFCVMSSVVLCSWQASEILWAGWGRYKWFANGFLNYLDYSHSQVYLNVLSVFSEAGISVIK